MCIYIYVYMLYIEAYVECRVKAKGDLLHQ